MFRIFLVSGAVFALGVPGLCSDRQPTHVIPPWPDTPPGPSREIGEEKDSSGPDSRLAGGRPVIRLTNVSVPQAHVYLPPVENRNGSVVLICPGGGFNILAWDLEGTEVAEWFNSIGVAAVVVKYRVPSRSVDPHWLLPVMDVQRAISFVRTRSEEWELNPDRIGVLGFSAGGHTAVRTALAEKRYYEAIDTFDQASAAPNAVLLIYPAYLINKGEQDLADDLVVTDATPPMFLVHAFDDPHSAAGTLLLAAKLRSQKVPTEVHVYDAGGHGFGLRAPADMPVASWPQRCEDWLRRNRWLVLK